MAVFRGSPGQQLTVFMGGWLDDARSLSHCAWLSPLGPIASLLVGAVFFGRRMGCLQYKITILAGGRTSRAIVYHCDFIQAVAAEH